MKITFIQNSPYAGPGLIGEYASTQLGAEVTVLFKEELFHLEAEQISTDLVVILGSPRGVYETEVPWVARQTVVVKKLIERGMPIFGICFGAQMAATAIGGEVKPTGTFYTGWMKTEPLAAPVWQGPWLRWHGDHITLPTESTIFSSVGGIIQAFQSQSVVGVQFHPEVTHKTLDEWAQNPDFKSERTLARELAFEYAAANQQKIRDSAFRLFDHIFNLLNLPINLPKTPASS